MRCTPGPHPAARRRAALPAVLVAVLVASVTVLGAGPPPAAASPVRTYTYEVRGRGNSTDLEAFAAQAAETLGHPASWTLGGSLAFRRVASGGQFVLWLSAASSVPSFGAPCDSTYSCQVGSNVVINETRWLQASPAWVGGGGTLRDYRHMVVNHEVGHWLGFGHASCGGAGQLAPVMQQQSISLQGCRPNPWPLAWERSILSRWTGAPILPPAPPPGARPGGSFVAVNTDGRFETFAITSSGLLMNAYQWAVGQGWSGWYPHQLGWPAGQDPSVGAAAGGELHAFAATPQGLVLETVQLPIGQGWSVPTAIGSYVAAPPVVARNLDGRLELVVVVIGGALWHTWQVAPGGAWAPWAPLGGSSAWRPGIGTTADGRLAVVGVGPDGTVSVVVQLVPNGGWGPPVVIGGGAIGPPAIGRNADGRLEVVVRLVDGRLAHAWQWGGVWSAVTPFGPERYAGPPVVGSNADGRLTVAAVGASPPSAGALVLLSQGAPNGGWAAPVAVGSGLALLDARAPGLAANGDGRLEAFAFGVDGALWHTFQTQPNGGWSPLYSLGGSFPSA